jgi:acetate kinase
VGFKAVQAGERSFTTLIDDGVLSAMEEYNDLAPAHNPAYLEAMRMFGELMPGKSLVGVFAPGFHVDKPDYARVYGAPFNGIEKYGCQALWLSWGFSQVCKRRDGQTFDFPIPHTIDRSCHLGGFIVGMPFKDGVSIELPWVSRGVRAVQSSRSGDYRRFCVPIFNGRPAGIVGDVFAELGRSAASRGLSGVSETCATHRAEERGYMALRVLPAGHVLFVFLFNGRIHSSRRVWMPSLHRRNGAEGSHPARVGVVSLGFLGFRLDKKRLCGHRERIDAFGIENRRARSRLRREIIRRRDDGCASPAAGAHIPAGPRQTAPLPET